MTRGRLIKANKTPFQYFFEPLGNFFFFFATAFESRNSPRNHLSHLSTRAESD